MAKHDYTTTEDRGTTLDDTGDDGDLPFLDTVLKADNVVKCPDCGHSVWMDIGIGINAKENIGAGPRFQQFGLRHTVYACANCRAPVVNINGDWFDARKWVNPNDIINVLQLYNGHFSTMGGPNTPTSGSNR